MTRDTLSDTLHELRITKAALQRERQRAEAEKRRADLAEQHARTAWQIAAWRTPGRRDTDA